MKSTEKHTTRNVIENCFFVFGTSQGQDIFPLLFESLRRGKKTWVCFFDSLYKKRQLADYTADEVKCFFSRRCIELGIDQPTVNFYGKKDSKKFEEDYKENNPEFVFVQEIKPKYPLWYPKAPNSRIIHLAWWDESHHLKDPLINPEFSILKRKTDEIYYSGYETKYFGNLRLDHLKYAETKSKQKTCFIPETYLRMGSHSSDSKKVANFCQELISFLHKEGFKVIWKKREKGYPRENWASPLDFCSEQPDVIIEKDLNFPSSLISEAYTSDVCLVVNDCFAFFDLIEVNSNVKILTTPGGRAHKIHKFFLPQYSDYIIDMKNESGWTALKKSLSQRNLNSCGIENTAGKIIDYLEEN